VQQFEAKFKIVAGTKCVVALNSGTAALHAIMAALNLNSGDEVIVPANTFASTANSVLYVGAKPVLADCEKDSFNVTSESIERSFTKRTKAVIVTHVAGNPCEMDPIISLCRENNLVLAEDAAHAVGGTYKGRKCGSLSWAGTFSLYPTKIITSAEGGFIATDSEELRDFARLFRNVGRAAFGSGPITSLGYNYRMSDIHAAIGLNQLGHLGQFLRRRNRLAASYTDTLRSLAWIRPQRVEKHSMSTYYSYIVKLDSNAPVSRDALAQHLQTKGIETTVMFRPVHTQPYFEKFSRQKEGLANSEAIGLNSLTLPMHPGMTEEDVDYIVKAIKGSVT